MLNYYDDIGATPTIDLDFGDPLTREGLDGMLAPATNTNGSGGYSVNDALNNILGLFSKGVEVYKEVDALTGGSASNVEQTQARTQEEAIAKDRTIVFGLSANTVLLIASGLTVVLVASMVLRGRK